MGGKAGVRPPCSVPGCLRRHNAQGFCRVHYDKARKEGIIQKLSDADRFWRQVEKTESCWLWTGTLWGNGYSQFGVNGGKVPGHRYSWEMANGPMPAHLLACHTCDVPTCVRPDHIYAGTHKDNVRDMLERGRYRNGSMGKTHCKRDHPLSGENLKLTSGGRRACRTCRRMYETAEWRNRDRKAAA